MSAPVSARKDPNNCIYSTGPDVCWTPMGSAMVPVAYNSIVFLKNPTRTLSHVKDNLLNDFNLNSRAPLVTGHEPGTGRGVKVPGYRGFAFAVVSTSKVYTNGNPIVRDGDPAMLNSADEGPPEKQAAWTKETI